MIKQNTSKQNIMQDDLQNKIRFKFWKSGPYKYFSHLDIISILSRAVRRAGIRIKYSEGFNPKPKMSFGPPTPLGIESHAEYGDISVVDKIKAEDFLSRLNDALQDRLIIDKAVSVPPTMKSIMSQTDIIKYSIYLDRSKTIGHRDHFSDSLPDLILKENEQVSGSIYSFEKTETGESSSTIVLNLLGYAKILKDTESKVFKLREFKVLLEEVCKKHGIDILQIVKEELYIIDGERFLTPFEIL